MRNRYVLFADLIVFALAAFGAFILRFDWFFTGYHRHFFILLATALAAKPIVFWATGMYRRFWRYTSVQDAISVVLASTAAAAVVTLMIVGAVLAGNLDGFSRSVLFADWLLTVCGTLSLRVGIRVLGEARRRTEKPHADRSIKRALIAGAGDDGAIVVRELRRTPRLGLDPIGFLDDDIVKHGKRILGLPVMGALRNLGAVVRENDVHEVIIAMPRAQGSTLRSIVERCRKAKVSFRMIPGMYELIGGDVSVTRLRNVEITDLLRRAPAPAEKRERPYLRGRILVTGGGGSIGLELCRQIANAQPEALVLLGHGENSIFEAHANLVRAFPEVDITPVIADIRDAGRMHLLMQRYRPTTVVHAAAHKHVPLMEYNPAEAISNNVVGTRIVVDAALAHGVQRLIFISTDKAVTPASLMGAAKRVGEQIVRDAAVSGGRAFAVVRFGNVLGSRGSVVPILKQQIAAGGPVTVTHPDMRRFFMTIPEAVHLVLQAGGMAKGGELFALNMGHPVKILDLAQDLIRLSGFSPDEMPIVYSGLRPGEKFEELLWEPGAQIEATEHTEILRIKESSLVLPPDIVERLAMVAAREDRLQLEAMLAELIPSFTPPSTPRTPGAVAGTTH